MVPAIPFRRLLLRLLVPAVLLFPSAIQAQQMNEEIRDPTIYFSLRGGWAIMHDAEFSRFSSFYTAEPDAESSFDGGWTGSASVGYRGAGPWRAEFEYSQWSNTFDAVQWNRYGKFGGYPTSGTFETRAYMVNFIAEMQEPAGEGFRPFVGLGVGVAQFDMKDVFDEDGVLFTGGDTSFAFQFIFGIDFLLTEKLAFNFAYKLFGSNIDVNVDWGQPWIGGDRVLMPVGVSSILVGVTYDF